jgi:urease accessory protein
MPAPITITTMMTTRIEPLLRLLTWLSPAFPVGAFAYSHGLEWAIEAGDVCNETSLRRWLEALLAHGSARSDVILLRHAGRAAASELRDLCELGAALAPCRERQAETLAQGAAFARAALVWGGARLHMLATCQAAYPIVVGAVAADHGIEEDLAAAGYAQAMAANLISAAVRLVPLGQTAGLRTLAALEPVLLELVRETASATLEEVGGCCFRSDIAAMRHETQHTRLFRT